MSLIYKVGDVLRAGESIVIHGCNCHCTMGAGIAKQVRAECPNAWSADQRTLPRDRTKMGSFTYGVEASGMIVVNAYTQYDYTRTSVDVDYNALDNSIRSIIKYFYQTYSETTFAMPKIGCGLAGGDWNIVEKILLDILKPWQERITIKVYTLE